MTINEHLKELGIKLPQASKPAAHYSNCVLTGDLLFVSGKGPTATSTGVPRGKLGREFNTTEGYQFARLTGLDILAAVQDFLGTLDRVERVVKLQGFINATSDFEDHPRVLDGASELMTEVFGEQGLHARSVFGANSLRGDLPVIIDSIFVVKAGTE